MADYGGAMMRNAGDSGVQGRTKAQNRANVLQLKLIGQSHPTGLTANLLKLFEPRPPLEFKPPLEKRKCPAYSGMAQFVSQFANPSDPDYKLPAASVETKAEKKARIRNAKIEKGAAHVAEELQKYDPHNDPNVTGDPYKTLFVARLNYETSEHRVKREFEAYGPIKKVRLVTDKVKNKPRGYAFIEYMHTRDMKTAYKQADGKKVDNKRVLVDVERGRTVPNWRPRRLGGGLGSSRITTEATDHKQSAREPQAAAAGRPRSEEPRREERHVERDREKSRERPREREPRERERESESRKTHERSHDRPRDRDAREERHHRDRDRTKERERDRDRGRDREREHDRSSRHDRDRDRGDRDRERGRDREKGERDRGRESHDRDREHDRERDRDHDRHRDRGRDRERDHERASYERSHAEVHDRAAGYDNIEPGADREMADLNKEWREESEHAHEYSYHQYDEHNNHRHYEYNQDGDGNGHDADWSRRHERDNYDQAPYHKTDGGYPNQSHDLEADQPEEGEAFDEHDYQYRHAGEAPARN